MVKIKFGDIETSVLESQLDNYLSKGWELVIKKNEPIPTNYDSYTEKQLSDIAKVRGMNFEVSELTKEQMIKTLIDLDKKEQAFRKPTNLGFTDGLILE